MLLATTFKAIESQFMWVSLSGTQNLNHNFINCSLKWSNRDYGPEHRSTQFIFPEDGHLRFNPPASRSRMKEILPWLQGLRYGRYNTYVATELSRQVHRL